MKVCYLLLLTILTTGCFSNKNNQEQNESVLREDQSEIRVSKIWDEAAHSAFTDLVYFNGMFFCSFREGPDHVSGPNGSARVIRSLDGEKWESIAYFEISDRDIRDPKLSITPDNKLMLLIDVESYKDGKVITRKPYVSFSDGEANQFGALEEGSVDSKIVSESNWVWRVTWYEGLGYAINYTHDGIYLVKTKNGKTFDFVSQLDVDGYPNESTVRFDEKGKMYVLIRREKEDRKAVLATADAPYTEWSYTKMSERVGGPNFIFLDTETLLIGTRLYPKDLDEQNKISTHKTGILITDLQGNIRKEIVLPSDGDSSYPGMLIFENKLWFSYYSSHEGKTSIYLTKMPIDDFLVQ